MDSLDLHGPIHFGPCRQDANIEIIPESNRQTVEMERVPYECKAGLPQLHVARQLMD